MVDLQSIVIFSTFIIFFLTLGLAVYITIRYLKSKKLSQMFWAIGLWAFALSVFLEIIFAIGIYTNILMSTYLFLVVLIVVLLALGSIQLVKSEKLKKLFYIFAILSVIYSFYSIITSTQNNLIITYVVAGVPTLPVIISSSIATFVSAFTIAIIAGNTYLKTKNKKMLSIFSGVIIVSIAGTLYIAAFPELLYYSEFIGILLLWYGFI